MTPYLSSLAPDGTGLAADKARHDLDFAKRFAADEAGLGAWRADVAASHIEAALSSAWDLPGGVRGLFVLGLGKLGGRDLNFSSDVDLVAFYTEDFPTPRGQGAAYSASRILKRMTQTLQPRYGDAIWRVDWRLRPEASATGLAMAAERAIAFYAFRAAPWHRLALMKARIVAGDQAVGQDFLDHLSPLIWRRNLDFRTLDELAHLKTRINTEHPGVATEREDMDARDFNLKLGRGGIREIEFITNAQQLIHGGKLPELRTPNTLEALSCLGELCLVADSQLLATAYRDLRRAEDAAQMIHNAQTHNLPDDERDRDTLLRLVGKTNWPDYLDQLNAHRDRVHVRFKSLFASKAVLEPTPHSDHPVIRGWLDGFTAYGVGQAGDGRYATLAADLAARVGDDPHAIARLDRFFGQIARSETYFQLLAAHPALLDRLVTPLLDSPVCARLLEQSPHIIDTYLLPQMAPNPAFVLADTDVELRLERLRRFVNENLYREYEGWLRNPTDGAATRARLARIAELTVETAFQIVADDLDVDVLPMAALALGKLGTGEMLPESDLDLIFIFADDCDPVLSAQIVRRLKTALATPMREGIAYELDLRLRPNGRSGPPAVPVSAFRYHHNARAKSWEHIALVSARVVAGRDDVISAAETVLTDLRARPRDQDQFLSDAMRMWQRLSEQRQSGTDLKLRPGGLMEAEYVRDCRKVLGKATLLSAEIDMLMDGILTQRLTGEDVQIAEATFDRVIDARRTLFAEVIPSEIETPVIWE